MTKTDQAMYVLKTLVEAAGSTLEPARHILAHPHTNDVAKRSADALHRMHDAAINGFFYCAAQDRIFTEIGRVKGCYGRGLEEVYPGATPTFMKLARTYWTFKVALIDCGPNSSVCVNLLWAIDEAFAGVFFPTPGPFSPPKKLREETMRGLIRQSGADFDEEDYIRGNYYLR